MKPPAVDASGKIILTSKGLPVSNDVIREEDIECEDEPVSTLSSIPVDT